MEITKEFKETKICCYCKTEKRIGGFYKDKSRKDGISNKCKICANDKNRKYAIDNKEKLDEYKKEYNKNHKEDMKQYNKEYYKNHKEDIIRNNNEYEKMKLDTDPTFKLIKSLRRRTQLALKGNTKSEATKELLGIASDIFTKWIEFQFIDPEMSLNNYGSYWHLDHVIPISSFDLSDKEQQRKAFNWINVQPLEASKNIQKSDKIDPWLFVCQEVKSHNFLKNLE